MDVKLRGNDVNASNQQASIGVIKECSYGFTCLVLTFTGL